MILIMDTRTLNEEYIKEGASQLLRDEYVMISSRIRKTKELDNVMNASSILYSMHKFLHFKDDNGSDLENIRLYQEFLSQPKQLAMLVALIETDIVGDGNVILLCSPNEMKYQKYMKYLARCIEDMFKYPVYHYVKGLSVDGLELMYKEDLKLNKCLKRIVSARDFLIKDKISTEKGKVTYKKVKDAKGFMVTYKLGKKTFNEKFTLSKKELKELAKEYEDVKGLSKEELRDILRDNL